jgi:hypothetical protein
LLLNDWFVMPLLYTLGSLSLTHINMSHIWFTLDNLISP